MKKIFAFFLAVALILTAAIPAFSAPADNTQGLYKYCSDFECAKINKADATVCRKCAKPFDENSASCFEFRNYVDEDEGGSFFRCPECSWISDAAVPAIYGECPYCDADLSHAFNGYFSVLFAAACPECGEYNICAAKDVFDRCSKCGCDFTDRDDLNITRYTSDPLDPNENWEELPETQEYIPIWRAVLNHVIDAIIHILLYIRNWIA